MGSQEEAAVTQPVKKKARLAPQAALAPIHANKALRFHFVSSIEQVLLSSTSTVLYCITEVAWHTRVAWQRHMNAVLWHGWTTAKGLQGI